MKTTFKVVLFVLVAAFYSCGKDEVSSASSSITSDGAISGTISNYSANSVDSIAFNGEFGGKVSSNGKFSVMLPIPASSELEVIGATSGVTISNPQVKMGSGVILAFGYLKGVTTNGELMKVSSDVSSTTTIGYTFSSFVYVDGDVTLKGKQVINDMGVTTNTVWDVQFKKGWNEMVTKIDAVSLSLTDMSETISVSTNIPSNLKWIYGTDNASVTASKVKVLNSLLKK